MEKFFFKQIELWIVLLIIICMCLGTLFFGAGVRHQLKGGNSLGAFGEALVLVASAPSILKEIISAGSINPKIVNKQHLLAKKQRFEGEGGWYFSYTAWTKPHVGYLLLSRYDGDIGRSVVELVDLNTQKVLHHWAIDVDPIWSQMQFETKQTNFEIDKTTTRFRARHALLLSDGSLVVQGDTPLMRVDVCSQLEWIETTDVYHHSIELDHDGNIWAPTHIEPISVQIGSDKFRDDALTKVSPDGRVLFQKSVIQLLDENGLGYFPYALSDKEDDPIHLNDIQPVFEDGYLWKRGDVFISIRTLGMVVLYRPHTNQVIWHKFGPWQSQHDVVILDDHRISIFNNYRGRRQQTSLNEELVYDFKTDTVSSPFKDAFGKLDIRTRTEGRGQILNDDSIFVEETLFGRLIHFNDTGEVIWQYINRAQNGKIYYLNWSRPISRELGDEVRKAIDGVNCKND